MAVKYPGIGNPTPYNTPTGGIPGYPIGVCVPIQDQPRAALVEIDWTKYTSGYVIVDLSGVQPGSTISKVKSVYIDNIGLVLPVVVYFPDTQCEVTCQSNATIGQSVLTGQLKAIIILGSTSLSLSSLQAATTRIYFNNVPIEAFNSPITPQTVIQQEISNFAGTPQAFAPKPAGDIRALLQVDLSNGAWSDLLNGGAVSAANLLANYPNVIARAGSYYVVTDIRAYTRKCYMQNFYSGLTSTDVEVAIGPNALGDPSIFNWFFPIDMEFISFPYRLLQESHGLYTILNPAIQLAGFVKWNGVIAPAPPPATYGFFVIDFQFSYISQN